MSNQTRVLVPAIFTVAIIALSFAAGYGLAPALAPTPIEETQAYVDNLYVTVKRDGQVIYYDEAHNIVTDIGLDWVEDQISDSPSATTIAKYIALSNNNASYTPNATWTKLPTPEITTGGLDRQTATYTNLGTGSWKLEKVFTATSDGWGNITLVGLHWDSTDDTDNNLYAAGTISSVNLMTNDQLNITWTHSIANS